MTTVQDYEAAKRDILDESAHLEARLRAMYLIKNDGKTYENACILMEASTKTKSVLLEHELYYNLGQFQLMGKPTVSSSDSTSNGNGAVATVVEEGDDIIRFLMKLISSTSPRHDSISRHEALEALGAIFAHPLKGLAPTCSAASRSSETEEAVVTNTVTSSAFPNIRSEVFAYLDDLAKNERIVSVRQSAELARDRLSHADATKEMYLEKLAIIKKRWVDGAQRDCGHDESSDNDNKAAAEGSSRLCFETKWVCPSQVHHYLSVDPSPAFDEEEDDAILAGYKRWQNAAKTAERVKQLALILRNEECVVASGVENENKENDVVSTGASPATTTTTQPANYSLFDRYRAMFSLRNIGSTEAIEILSESLNTDKSSALFRHEIAFVLGQIEKNSCEKALIECLCNPKEAGMVRHEAAIAIGGIAQPTGLAALEANANDRDAIVSDSCIAGLEMHRYWTEFMERARKANEEEGNAAE